MAVRGWVCMPHVSFPTFLSVKKQSLGMACAALHGTFSAKVCGRKKNCLILPNTRQAVRVLLKKTQLC